MYVGITKSDLHSSMQTAPATKRTLNKGHLKKVAFKSTAPAERSLSKTEFPQE